MLPYQSGTSLQHPAVLSHFRAHEDFFSTAMMVSKQHPLPFGWVSVAIYQAGRSPSTYQVLLCQAPRAQQSDLKEMG